MAKPSVLRHNATSGHLDYQTWILKVYIHCEGCKKKVFKVLQSIDGVYKTEIDSKQHKAIVSGSVDGNTLVQKLLKSGKHAEILPESFEATPAADSGSEKSKKKKQINKQKDGVTKGDDKENVNDEKKEESEATTTDGSDAGNSQEVSQPPVAGGDANGNGGGGKKKKNKKTKGDKKDGDTPPNGETDGATTGNAPANTGVTRENVEAFMEKLNLNPPINQMVYARPYDLPPYHNYYPTPAYGMSYNTSYPSTESSYYTPPVYGYAQSHPSVYYPPPPPPWYYPRSAFDDENQDGRVCTIM
ncbi:heavy metal-associated isoprenylated plant protein 36-like [Cynara cardunculus var. scolymus]|uniref:Heavy metal-associated domain, HMA n=1 Tax=Cynara cardunculus var. scolymus TaxID=59895 RepID=A0A103YNN9_CYNCS|nr:heavy metal-associated isoprenylated plant protein 36-like [Cynara cardunculus var. scolymus]KVI12470.1 Heavy metal-associated domain, HMA [Cynara cardunculus var. scolymus]